MKNNKEMVKTVGGVAYRYTIGRLGKGGGLVAMIVDVKGAKGDLVVPEKLGKVRVAVIGDFAFFHCRALKSVALPEGLKVVGFEAFDGCTGLRSVEFSNGLVAIHAYAFTGCTALKSVVIPGSVELLAPRVFEDCTALESVQMSRDAVLGYLAYNRKYNVKLGFGVPKVIREDADKVFEGCTGLKTVTVVGGATPAIRKALRGMKVEIRTEKATPIDPRLR